VYVCICTACSYKQGSEAATVYEVPVQEGKFYPQAVQFKKEGTIFYKKDDSPESKKVIGHFKVDVERKFKLALGTSFVH
jgi:hypothetical protein